MNWISYEVRRPTIEDTDLEGRIWVAWQPRGRRIWRTKLGHWMVYDHKHSHWAPTTVNNVPGH
jgi:hypothetical protein